jgi:coproporphyrinogen III oxidase-like Fe-S oxidoreductase
LYDITQEMTAAHGLPQYEISNHARPGEESRHNLLYWRYGEYAGIGPGAHGRIIAQPSHTRHATSTERSPEGWLARVEADGDGRTEQTLLTPAEEADEMLLMGLRLVEGLDLARLDHVSGAVVSSVTVRELVDLGMIETLGNSRIRATGSGRFVLNALVAKLSQTMTASR